MCKFVDEVLYDDAQLREEDVKRVSQHVLDAMADLELHAMRLAPGKHLKGRTLMGGLVKPEEFDYFHELIITQEMTRVGARGYGTRRVVPDILKGKLFISLAISEAYAGSDDGKFWIVNGSKKWITNGTFSDYFITGVRTDGGLTVLLIERVEGVPVENTLDHENDDLRVILSNFNHERWVMCCASARSQRLVIEESLTWANQRQVFGKPLIAQAVIRNKLAQMIARTEAGHNWLENVTHQMDIIGFLKMHLTQNAQDPARDAVQIFGGRGITGTDMGRFIEHYHRTIAFDALIGGEEDVLGDLGVRQAIPMTARL
ncbi:hypothetical protein AURDEDRAFT_168825 [Auricularia subglabra TFB-10046 SS5]|nr:hypothetical protein AURDEDRAFT_168825 [Auricularia subglabra TFB-10046 SS5]